MTTDQEKRLFEDKDPTKKLSQHDLVMKLSKLVRERMCEVLEKADNPDIKVPKSLIRQSGDINLSQSVPLKIVFVR